MSISIHVLFWWCSPHSTAVCPLWTETETNTTQHQISRVIMGLEFSTNSLMLWMWTQQIRKEKVVNTVLARIWHETHTPAYVHWTECCFFHLHRSELRRCGGVFTWRPVGGCPPSSSVWGSQVVTSNQHYRLQPRKSNLTSQQCIGLLFKEPGAAAREGERENKHGIKETLFMNSPKLWKANSASWLAALRRHVDNEYGLAPSPSLHRPARWMLSYRCHRKWCHPTPLLHLQ